MDWRDVITPAAYHAAITIMVLLLGFLMAPPRWKRFAVRPKKIPPPVLKCFRIQEIPATVTEEELLRQLAESIPGFSSQHSDGLRLKIARSFGEHSTATFKSTEAPKNLKYPIDYKFNGVTPLHEGKAATVDIFAVHGLGSHAIGGFQSKESKMVWLRDFLSNDFPNSRILVYGYDSAITDKNNKISIAGLAKTMLDSYKAFRHATETTRRPIIFIGHSLGGLLIKEALFMAHEGDEDHENSDFFKSTSALMFFGVPNLGIRLGKLKQITSGQINNQLIGDLELDSESEPTPYLRTLQERFTSCHKKQNPPMRIISYYEERKTDTPTLDKNGNLRRGGHMCFMVTQDSACQIGFEHNIHDKLPLPSDHSNLVKFLNESDDGYRRVQNKLRRLVEEGPGIISKRFISPTKLSPEEKRHWDDLNVPDYRAFIESKKLAKPTQGTLQWLVQKDPAAENTPENTRDLDSLQRRDFEAWKNNSKPCALLVVGSPGQGKSVLSNFIVEHLQKQKANGSQGSIKVIYFFCNIKDDNDKTASSILRALIVQLCEDRRLFSNLPNRFQEYKSFYSDPFDSLWRTFYDMVSRSPYTWIHCVIDGLDVYEDPEMETLVNKLHDMVKDENSHRLKLFFTSRPTGPVETFTPETKRILRPPRKDIEVFIQREVKLWPRKFKDFTEEILNSILASAGGTFLWINIVLREIRKLPYPSRTSILAVLKKIPQELSQLYTSLIKAAFTNDHDIAILAWVAYAKRPLCLEELETAVAVMVTNGKSWADCKQQKASLDHNSIHDRLGTLVDIIDDKLYLIHQSLLDFLNDQPIIWQKTEFELNFRRHPSIELGRVCMNYLSFNDLDINNEPKAVQSWAYLNSFLNYASSHWYDHIRSAQDVAEDIEKLKCLLEGPNKSFWLQRNSRHRNSSCRTRSLEAISTIPLMFDIGWLARLLMDHGIPGISDNFTENDLVIAAGGAPKVFQELLLNDTLPKANVIDKVVMQAVQNQRSGKMILELLLELRGDEVQITQEVVLAAVDNRFGKDILELLLEKRGYEVQITQELLIAAAANGTGTETLELLLEKGDFEVQIPQEALIVISAGASFWGKEALMILLEKRDDEVQKMQEVLKAASGAANFFGEETLKQMLKEAIYEGRKSATDKSGEETLKQMLKEAIYEGRKSATDKSGELKPYHRVRKGCSGK